MFFGGNAVKTSWWVTVGVGKGEESNVTSSFWLKELVGGGTIYSDEED